MSGMLRKGMSWLGLGPDEGYDEYDDYDDDLIYDEPEIAPVAQNPVVRAVPNTQRVVPSRVEPDSDWDDIAEPSSVRVLPSAGGRTMASAAAEPVRPRSNVVRPIAAATSARPHVVNPQSFNDAQEVGDLFKKGQPVIVNLQDLDRDLARRLLDFSSGVAYGLGGSVERVASHVYLLTPTDVQVSADERRKLRERGLHDD